MGFGSPSDKSPVFLLLQLLKCILPLPQHLNSFRHSAPRGIKRRHARRSSGEGTCWCVCRIKSFFILMRGRATRCQSDIFSISQLPLLVRCGARRRAADAPWVSECLVIWHHVPSLLGSSRTLHLFPIPGDRFCGAHAAHIFHGKAPGREKREREGCNRSRGRKSSEMRAHTPTHFTPQQQQQQRLKRPFLFLDWCRKCTTSQENRADWDSSLSWWMRRCSWLYIYVALRVQLLWEKSFLRCSERNY